MNNSHRSQQQQRDAEQDAEYGVENPPDLFSTAYDKASKTADELDSCPSSTESYEHPVGYHDDEQVQHGHRGKWYLLVAVILVLIGAALGVAFGMTSGGDKGSAAAMGAVGSYDGDYMRPNDHSDTSNSSDEAPAADDTEWVGDMSNQASISTAAPTSEVFDIILSHSRFHGLEFQDPASYQSRAAQWVDTTAQLGVHSIDQLVQRYALACLYYATNGVSNKFTDQDFGVGVIRGWIDETGWLVDEDECSWYHVGCNDEGLVTSITLHQNRLTGKLPPELALLKDSLTEMDLYQNYIYNHGDDEHDWLGELTQLQKLYYGRTFMSYWGIPKAISKLTNLVEYDCSFSLYHGPLDGSIFQPLDQLEYLYIGGNSYNSTVPQELAQLPNLEYLYLEYTDLMGDLEFIAGMPSIIELWMDRNPAVTGTIPTELGTVSTLKSFSITGMNVAGPIPSELGELRLQGFWCYSNQLTGTIPEEFGQMNRLKRLEVEDNQLEGTMPSGICANRMPDGLLEKLAADCPDEYGNGGLVECECCTCCGPSCSSVKSPTGGNQRYL